MDIRNRMMRAVIKAQREGEHEAFVRPALAAGEELHRQNIANLYKNLDPRASRNLTDILRRREKILDPAVTSFRELYTDGEYKDFERFEAFSKEIVREGDHFRYKDFKLPVKDFEAGVFLYRHGLDSLKTLKSIRNKAIMDVGGFIGDSILVFHDACPGNRIYSFEPNNKNYAFACDTLKINGLHEHSVVLENLALGDRAGLALISQAAEAGAQILSDPASGGQSVKMDTLDNYVARHGIKVGLIKVDTEGHEQLFLQGALETIKTQKPILLLSIYHNYSDFFQVKPLIEDLHLGYKFDFFKGIDHRIWTDIMLLCEVC